MLEVKHCTDIVKVKYYFYIRTTLQRNLKKILFPVDSMCRLHPEVAFVKLTN